MSDHWEDGLTDEAWNRLAEICQRYFKDSGPGAFTFTGSGQKILDWSRDKYRALYDLEVFVAENAQGGDDGGDAPIKSVDREVFARLLADAARDYLTERVRDAWQATVTGIITEMDMNLDALKEKAFGADFDRESSRIS